MQTKKIKIYLCLIFGLCAVSYLLFSSSNHNDQKSVLFGSATSATSPSTVVNLTGVGTTAWTNPSNAVSSDNVYATVGLDDEFSNYLKATNFGFNIPAGSTIDGVVVEVERKSIASDQNKDTNVKLVKGGVISGNNKADTATYWSTTDTYKSYGASNDLWGVTLTPTDVNASDFGVVFSVYGFSNFRTGYVDHIRITIYYTSSGGSATVSGQGIISFE